MTDQDLSSTGRVFYHGTKNIQNALSISQGTGTWKVGWRSNYGTGIYFGDRTTALSYTGWSGVLIKLLLTVPENQIPAYHEIIWSKEYKQWQRQHREYWKTRDKVAVYVTEVLKKRFIKVRRGSYAALVHPAYKKKFVTFQGLYVLGIFDRRGNQIH